MADLYGSDYITIVDEDGEEFELEVLMTMEYNGATYQAVIPAVDADEEVDLEVSMLRTLVRRGRKIVPVIIKNISTGQRTRPSYMDSTIQSRLSKGICPQVWPSVWAMITAAAAMTRSHWM